MSAGRPRLAGGNRHRRAKGGALTEAQWQGQVEGLARMYGWRVYHTHDSRRSAAGFPDLVMVRGPELVFAELKGEHTRVTPEQKEWLRALLTVADSIATLTGPEWRKLPPGTTTPRAGVDVFIWRAPDLEPVHDRLARGRRRHEPIGAV